MVLAMDACPRGVGAAYRPRRRHQACDDHDDDPSRGSHHEDPGSAARTEDPAQNHDLDPPAAPKEAPHGA